jgi:hypothetical protein
MAAPAGSLPSQHQASPPHLPMANPSRWGSGLMATLGCPYCGDGALMVILLCWSTLRPRRRLDGVAHATPASLLPSLWANYPLTLWLCALFDDGHWPLLVIFYWLWCCDDFLTPFSAWYWSLVTVIGTRMWWCCDGLVAVLSYYC